MTPVFSDKCGKGVLSGGDGVSDEGGNGVFGDGGVSDEDDGATFAG